jgi:Flp pilus assembly pilin Flp
MLDDSHSFIRRESPEMVEYFKTLFRVDEETEGQGLVEYALIIFLVSIAAILTLTALGAQVNAVFAQITAAL